MTIDIITTSRKFYFRNDQTYYIDLLYKVNIFTDL